MVEGDEHKFPELGVTVIIPPQDSSKSLNVKRRSLEGGSEMESDIENFRPGRLVITFDIVESENENIVVTDFAPAIELHIYYTEADEVFAAIGEQELKIAFWDRSKWIRLSEKHEFTRNPVPNDPRWTGFGQACIQSWGDPTIAIGR